MNEEVKNETVNAEAEAPAAQPETPVAEAPAKPFYKKGWFWCTCAGAAALIGIAAALIFTKEEVAAVVEDATDAE
jgi:hypothetical protein